MKKVYKIGKSATIFMYIAGSLMLLVFSCGIVLPLIPDEHGKQDLSYFYVSAPVFLVLLVIVALAMYNTIRGRLIIDQEKIYTTGSIPSRTLYFDQIKGFTIDPKGIINIMPHGREHKKIKISAYIGARHEIEAWLRNHVQDLDETHAQEQIAEALADVRIGETEEQRLSKLEQAQKLTVILNWAGALAAIWLLLKPVPYLPAVLSCVLIPLVVIAASKHFNGRMTIRTKDEKKVFPDATAGLGLPAAALAFRALADYHIYSFRQLWLPVLLAAAIWIIITVRGAKAATINPRRQAIIITTLSLIYLLYSVGLLVIANCYLDRSKPHAFQATILRKRSSRDNNKTSFWLKLSPWGPETESAEVGVRRPFYDQVGEGQTVIVRFRNGRLNVPWFVLQTEAEARGDTAAGH